MALSLALGLTSCQATPKEDVIVQKAELTEKLTQEAESDAAQNGKMLREQLGAPETVSFELTSSDGLGKILAEEMPVVIPETDRAGTATLLRDDFTDADTELWTKVFFADGEVWKYEERAKTKADWLAEWEKLQNVGEQVRQNSECEWSEEDEARLQEQLDYYLAQMEAAPEEAPDLKKEAVEYRMAAHHDEENGDYTMFDISGVVPGGEATLVLSYIPGNGTSGRYSRDQENSGIVYFADDSWQRQGIEIPNHCHYSEAEAIALLKAMIDQIEPENRLAVSLTEPIYEYKRDPESGEKLQPEEYLGYQITFARTVGGCMENDTDYLGQGVEIVVDESGRASQVSADFEPFGYEKIVGRVTDEGVIEFYWLNKMSEGELLADNVKLLPFDKIRDIMEQMLPMKLTGCDCDPERRVTRLQLGLMAARTPNDNESYTLLPVWDAYWVVEAEDAYWEEQNILTINAIDGSIIDRNYRY